MLTITPCTNPDLDGLACAVAYAEYYNKTGTPAQAIIFGQPRFEANFVINHFNYQLPPNNSQPDDWKQVAVVDTSRPDGLEPSIKLKNIIEVVDHRLLSDTDAFPNAKIWIEMVGAAATLIAEKFKQNNIKISTESATLIYGAIIANTLTLQSSNTTNRDREIARWLKPQINWPDNLTKKLFLDLEDMKGDKLLKTVQGETFAFPLNNQTISIGQLAMIGAKKLVATRHADLVTVLDKIKKDFRLDWNFINIIDVREKINIFFATDPAIQALLSHIFKVEFNNNYAIYPALLLRKEITPLIKKELEK